MEIKVGSLIMFAHKLALVYEIENRRIAVRWFDQKENDIYHYGSKPIGFRYVNRETMLSYVKLVSP